MAIPRYAQALVEERVGAGNTKGKEDTMNRASMDYYLTLWFIGHDDDGSHVLGDFLFLEDKKFTGDGNATQVITLDDSSLNIIWIKVSRPDTEYPVFASDTMAADETKQLGTNGFQAAMLEDIATTGEFTVGTDDAVNENLIEYHYFVIGTH